VGANRKEPSWATCRKASTLEGTVLALAHEPQDGRCIHCGKPVQNIHQSDSKERPDAS
jgi:hypothetical protein